MTQLVRSSARLAIQPHDASSRLAGWFLSAALVMMVGCAHPGRPAPAASARPAPAPAGGTDLEASAAQPSPTAGHVVPVAPTRGQADPSVADATRVAAQVDPDPAAQRASVADAAGSGRHPERLTPLIAPAPFDPQAYARDPQAYLSVVEPGRVYDTAPGGPDRVTLDHISPPRQEQPVGVPITLRVRGVPGAPTSFAVVLGSGRFGNGLSATTVQADGDGIASVAFTPEQISGDLIQVLAGSPLAVGTQSFEIVALSQEQTPQPPPADDPHAQPR